MASLLIVAAAFVGSVLLTAWALAGAARAVGSPRGRVRVGVAVVGFLAVVGIGCRLSVARLPAAATARPVVAAGLAAIADWVIAFGVMRAAFSLGTRRTFAPFAAYVVVGVAQVTVVWLAVQPFVVEGFVISTPSMSPTLEPGDRIAVEKLLRPRRLDVVAYRADGPGSPVYCKRLIGLPGDRLRFAGGGLYVDDVAVTLPPAIAGRCHAAPATAPRAAVRYHDGETIILGTDEFFVIGDNVDASFDSRLSGPILRSALIGVADLLYWPPGRFRVGR